MTIKNVIFKKRPTDHEDDRRILLTAFNDDVEGFVAKQVKFLVAKKDSFLGGHYHNYKELFYLLDGEIKFILKDIKTGEIEKYDLSPGYMLLVPKKVAHKLSIKNKSILVGCTEEPYISPKNNDIKHEF